MLQDKAMLARLNIGTFSPRKTDKKITKEVTDSHSARMDSGKFVKNLLPENALEQIKKISNEARTYHYDHTLPWSDEGARLLPASKFMEYGERMGQFSAAFYGAVDQFSTQWESYVAQARIDLNGMFNQDDYPSKDVVISKFRFKTEFSPVPSADDFRISVQEQEMDSLKANLNERLKDAEKEASTDLYRRLATPIRAMMEKLQEPDGRFRDSLVGNIQEMIEIVPSLNLSDDPIISQLVFEARELGRVNPNALRDNVQIRKDTARKAAALFNKMSGYM